MNHRTVNSFFRTEIKRKWLEAIKNNSFGLYVDEKGEIFTQGNFPQMFMGCDAFNVKNKKLTGNTIKKNVSLVCNGGKISAIFKSYKQTMKERKMFLKNLNNKGKII